jgi:hypothetical protein
MALVSCPECQKEVSTHALACPQCALPFPGKQARGVGQAGPKLHACPDCGCSVSKRAQTCPHCGVTLMGEQPQPTANGNTIEETWLCTHCGTPYTRKVRQKKELLPDHRADLPTSHVGHSVERLLDQRVVHQETVVPASHVGHRVESPLEPVVHQEAVVPTSKAGHSVSRKRSFLLARRDIAWKDPWGHYPIRSREEMFRHLHEDGLSFDEAEKSLSFWGC